MADARLRNSDSDDYWDLLAYDDEDTASPPYVQIYSDAGSLASLYYTTSEEQERALEFARRLVELKAERDHAREALRDLWDDIREVDKRFVPNDLVAKVKAALDG